eukprot:CAMPEP_0118688360 /NCGR_PEP_ID=MMETSP0800-20121206/8876_1 /TAXON_ID=210618 ORGANISM="Striatella unipunctata, Strain CCMP2910" /NCGR_SAMPLE_ID=MMETSP0800 /ASSEMBLY_ACC=CAM_ASM_000638 /LENGTH=78 /DNA_ID=CAMNT_0006585609 /DNA_START=24 /DNA_END=260 /DNA_ORIENTATION=+
MEIISTKFSEVIGVCVPGAFAGACVAVGGSVSALEVADAAVGGVGAKVGGRVGGGLVVVGPGGGGGACRLAYGYFGAP